jgi:serine/threonine-protein kinase
VADAPVQPGDVLAERYRIEAPLGAGGFGSIWRAHHQALDAPVAVKLIDPEIAKDPEARERFLREARAAANLRGQNVVQILDYGVEGDLAFIVMELLEGQDLAQRLKREGPLSPDELVKIFTQVCRAVGRAHAAGIIHRDLKPANVFLMDHEDADETAKVLDFGVAKVEGAKLSSAGAQTRTGSLIGTPHYMSPEQLQGNKTIDHRSDLWSLGVIAFEALTGRPPFESEGLGDLVLQICVQPLPVPSEWARVPRGFDTWMERALTRDPDKRFQSAKEMASTLSDALGGDGAELIGEERPLAASRDGDAIGLTPTVADGSRVSASLTSAPTTARKKKKKKRKKRKKSSPVKSSGSAPELEVSEPRTVAAFGSVHDMELPPSNRRWRLLAGALLAAAIAGAYAFLRTQRDAPVLAGSEVVATVNSVDALEEAGVLETEEDAAAGAAAHGADAGADAATDAASSATKDVASVPDATAKAPVKQPTAAPVVNPKEEWRPKVIGGKVVKPKWAVPDPPPSSPDPDSDNPY